MYPDLCSNSSARDSVDITVALIASTRDAEATNGLRIALDASMPSSPEAAPLPLE